MYLGFALGVLILVFGRPQAEAVLTGIEAANSAVLATAAYNAGPHRVTRWLPDRTLPADIWIELVPFS